MQVERGDVSCSVAISERGDILSWWFQLQRGDEVADAQRADFFFLLFLFNNCPLHVHDIWWA